MYSCRSCAGRSLTLVDESAHAGVAVSRLAKCQQIAEVALVTEGEGFEPSVDRKAHNGFEAVPITSPARS
jgi:hypothetical protein